MRNISITEWRICRSRLRNQMKEAICSSCNFQFPFSVEQGLNVKHYECESTRTHFRAGGIFPVCPQCESSAKIATEFAEVTFSKRYIPISFEAEMFSKTDAIEVEAKEIKKLTACGHKCHEIGLNHWIDKCPVCGCDNPSYEPDEQTRAIRQICILAGSASLGTHEMAMRMAHLPTQIIVDVANSIEYETALKFTPQADTIREHFEKLAQELSEHVEKEPERVKKARVDNRPFYSKFLNRKRK